MSEAEDAGRTEFPEGETLPPPLGCTGTSTRHKQSDRKDFLKEPRCHPHGDSCVEFMRDQLRPVTQRERRQKDS